MQKGKTVLYLDDNPDHRDLLKFLFEEAGYETVTCAQMDECLELLSQKEVAAVVMDYWLDGVETIEISKKIKELYPAIPFFFFTGDAQPATREKALQTGAMGYLLKPNDVSNIVPVVSRFFENSILKAA